MRHLEFHYKILAASAPIFNVLWIIFCFTPPCFVVMHVLQPVGICLIWPSVSVSSTFSFLLYLFCCRCEQLLGVNSNLRQELMLIKRDHGDAEQFHTLQENLALLLQTLVQKYSGLFQFWERWDCSVVTHHAITTDDYAILWKCECFFF